MRRSFYFCLGSVLCTFADCSKGDHEAAFGISRRPLLNGCFASTPKHGVFHDLNLDPDKLTSAWTEFLQMEKAVIVRRSSSPWSSPFHRIPIPIVPGGSVETYTTSTPPKVPDRYSVPAVADFCARIDG